MRSLLLPFLGGACVVLAVMLVATGCCSKKQPVYDPPTCAAPVVEQKCAEPPPPTPVHFPAKSTFFTDGEECPGGICRPPPEPVAQHSDSGMVTLAISVAAFALIVAFVAIFR